jgi:hypothetical protein
VSKNKCLDSWMGCKTVCWSVAWNVFWKTLTFVFRLEVLLHVFSSSMNWIPLLNIEEETLATVVRDVQLEDLISVLVRFSNKFQKFQLTKTV